jgi:hypothetical protein
MIIKAPKMSVYRKRRSSEALGTSGQQNVPKKMKITQSPQIVDLEGEEPKEKMSMEMVESGTKNEEAGTKACHRVKAAQELSTTRNMSLIRHLEQSTNPKKI